MAWSGIQRAKRLWSMGSRGELKSHRSWGCWGQHEGSPDWRVSGRQCPEPCPASASWRASNRRTVGLVGAPWGCMRLCVHTPVHAGGAWRLTLGDGVRGERSLPDGADHWLDANVCTCRRGCNGERAAGAPCQDCPLDKPPAKRGFVLQGDILQFAQARLRSAFRCAHSRIRVG